MSMNERTELGDRMKLYERREGARRSLPGLPICARIDGKRFSRWTAGLARPFDERLSRLMIEVTRHLIEESQARIGYTQSDEITLIYHAEANQQLYLDGRIQKLTSLLASMATARFNQLAARLLPERADTPATFDCRVWEVPSLDEAANVLLWREHDATKNSLSMAARAHFPHEVVEGKDSAEMHELLHTRGVNWGEYPAFFKRGTYVQRRTRLTRFSAEERASLPPRHHAHSEPDLQVERTDVVAMDMPPLGRVLNRLAVIFEGAAPIVAT